MGKVLLVYSPCVVVGSWFVVVTEVKGQDGGNTIKETLMLKNLECLITDRLNAVLQQSASAL